MSSPSRSLPSPAPLDLILCPHPPTPTKKTNQKKSGISPSFIGGGGGEATASAAAGVPPAPSPPPPPPAARRGFGPAAARRPSSLSPAPRGTVRLRPRHRSPAAPCTSDPLRRKRHPGGTAKAAPAASSSATGPVSSLPLRRRQRLISATGSLGASIPLPALEACSVRSHRHANFGQTSILLSDVRIYHTDFIPAQYFLLIQVLRQ